MNISLNNGGERANWIKLLQQSDGMLKSTAVSGVTCVYKLGVCLFIIIS